MEQYKLTLKQCVRVVVEMSSTKSRFLFAADNFRVMLQGSVQRWRGTRHARVGSDVRKRANAALACRNNAIV